MRHKDSIVIGAGKLYIDILDASDGTQGERYLGDAVAASLSVTTERTTVFSGSGAKQRVLKDVTRSVSRTLNLTLHDMSADNFALFAAGSADEEDAAATAVTDEKIAGVTPGRWYQLGTSKDRPAGIGAIEAATVVVTTDPAGTTYAVDDDYTIDAAHGRLHIVTDGAITSASDILVDYTPATPDRGRIKAMGASAPVRAALRYIEMAAAGDGRHLYAPVCVIAPTGDLTLMSGRDAEQQIQLTAEIRDPDDGGPALVGIDA